MDITDKKYTILFIIVILLIMVTAYNGFSNSNKRAGGELNVLPPFIFVFDKLYKGGTDFKTEEEFNNLELKPMEVGSIESKVSAEEMPSVNFQSNAATVGSILYYQYDYKVLYCKDEENKYWIYQIYKDN